MIKVSDYVLKRVAAAGVKHVFLVPGGAAMHLNDSLAGREDIGFVATYHEHAAAVAAEAYAKLTGNLGVAMVTAGPGSTNCLTGVTSAWVNSAPVLFISGQVKRSDLKGGNSPLRQLGLQEVDMVAAVKSLTKYAATVTDPATVRQHLDLALYHARHGRPGPVWLDFPLDLQGSQVEEETLAPAELPPAIGSATLAAAVQSVLVGLQQAERPLLLLGAGVRIAGGVEAAQELIDRLGIPFATTWMGTDLLDDGHPCFAGRPGSFAPRGANFAVQNCDFLLTIGARWDFATTGFSQAGFARAAQRVAVDVDVAELDKLRGKIETPILADARDFMVEMLGQLGSVEIAPARYQSWRDRIQSWAKEYPVVTPDLHELPGGVSTYIFVEELAEQLNSEDVLVQGSAGIHSEIFFMTFRFRAGQRLIADGSFGAMGYGVPAAIGACLGAGGRRTVLIDGDGSLMPNLQEFETIRRLNLPIKIMIVNNGGYASIRVSQQRWFNRMIAADASSGLTLPSYEKLAVAFGLPFSQIRTEKELKSGLASALSAPGPALVEILVPAEEDRRPRLSTFQKPDGTMVSKPLEDLFPFLDREEFKRNMIIPPLDE